MNLWLSTKQRRYNHDTNLTNASPATTKHDTRQMVLGVCVYLGFLGTSRMG